MNDGCYTNGAALTRMNNMAEEAGETKRLVSTCLSHCASNAGKKCSLTVCSFFKTDS